MKRDGLCEHLWKFTGDIFAKMFDRKSSLEMECELCGIGAVNEAREQWEQGCKWHDLGQDLGMIETKYR